MSGSAVWILNLCNNSFISEVSKYVRSETCDTFLAYVIERESPWSILALTAGSTPRALVTEPLIKSSHISDISRKVTLKATLTDYTLSQDVWEMK
jgi:hypothetical protein